MGLEDVLVMVIIGYALLMILNGPPRSTEVRDILHTCDLRKSSPNYTLDKKSLFLLQTDG